MLELSWNRSPAREGWDVRGRVPYHYSEAHAHTDTRRECTHEPWTSTSAHLGPQVRPSMRLFCIVVPVVAVLSSAEERCALGGSYSVGSAVVFDSVECTLDGSAWHTALVPMPGPRQFHAAAVWRGELCILGGLTRPKDVDTMLNNAECWAGGDSSWHALPAC